MKLSNQDIDRIIAIDAPQISSQVKDYKGENAYEYWLLTNVWAELCDSIAPATSFILRDALCTKGLLQVIRDGCEVADCIINKQPVAIDYWLMICKDMDQKQALLVTRFAKRFSPARADIVETESMRSFLQVNNNSKMRMRRPYPHWLTARMHEYIACAIAGYDSKNKDGSWKYDLDEFGYFSPGAVANTEKSKARKVLAWAWPSYRGFPLNIRPYPIWDTEYPIQEPGRDLGLPLRFPDHTVLYRANPKCAHVIPVPKSYKAARIIAEEDSSRQWYLQAINKVLRDRIKANGFSKEMPFEFQGRNQFLAFAGSLDGTYTTIDHSHASDSVSVALWIDAVGYGKLTRDILRYRSSYLEVDGKVYSASMLATSGAGHCFVCETLIFWSLARVATDLASSFLHKELPLPSVYGDDVVIATEAYETYSDLAEILGFEVNREKSFSGDSSYRESCGVEYEHGVDYSIKYWPRKHITFQPSSYASLVSLQHAYWEYPAVAQLLRDQIDKLAKGKASASSYSMWMESEVSDPISYLNVPCRQTKPVPMDKGCEAPIRYECHCDVTQVPILEKGMGIPDTVYYADFLVNGPCYESALDRLLGVSAPLRRDTDTACSYKTKLICTPLI